MGIESGYYRHPTIHGDRLVFVCEDDLWCVPVEGGVARRLTANPGTVSFPVLSPDGASIAFTGKDDGPTEVYVMDAEGGEPTRLTWLGGLSQVVGWSADGADVLFASDHRQPFARVGEIHRVAAKGGVPENLGHGPARAIAHEPEGAGVAIGRNSGDPARWKRYRGGTAGTLWVDRRGDGKFARLIDLPGNLASPMWVGKRIYFLSDHEGVGNLYSCTPTGRGLKRHTHHEDFYVRFPSTDGKRIAYHAGADLFVFDPETDEAAAVEVRIRSPRAQRNRRFVPFARHLESYALHPKGHSIALVGRGGTWAAGLWEGAPRRHGKPSAARYRLTRWLPDGKRLVAVTDEGGEEGLVVWNADGSGRPKRIEGDFGRAVSLDPAPAGGDRVALANQRQELILVDLKTEKARTVERSEFDRIHGVAWAPDGRWLAYGFSESRNTSSIHLLRVSTSRITRITRPEFRDVGPAFDPEGKYLYFVSWRVYNPVYDSLTFDLGFPRGARPYLVTLKKDQPSPFSTALREPRAPGAPAEPEKNAKDEGKKKDEKGGKDDKKPEPVEIDLAGIEDRVVAFPLPEGIYAKVAGAPGRMLYETWPPEGALDQDWFEIGPPTKGGLHAWVFEAEKSEPVAEKMTSFALSGDAKVLAIRHGARLRVVASSHKADKTPPKDTPSRETGWLDLARIRLEVVPADEWTQMFREAWRLQRDQFWTADMAGIDWPEVHDRYLPLVDRVASRAEFSDLMWEMQGELGTSHCYEMLGDYRPEPSWFQGFLGADLDLDPETRTWRIARLPRGDSWLVKSASPLAAPGVNLAVGDEILEIEGEKIDHRSVPGERLVHRAGRDVTLTVRSGKKRRSVTVETLKSEFPLRYRDWVEANRARVHEATEGRVGYIHVPDMGARGYSEFHRAFMAEVDRDGLVIDVRYNGGGHVSALLLEKLLRKRLGYDATRWGVLEPYPTDAPMGPMVALTNEYAGSDGDIFSHSFKMLGLGPLIGKRTWGGVVGVWPRHFLVDGTLTTQPEFSFWFEDVGWGVENYGTDPDIEVEIKPQDHAAGEDPQMDRALREIGKLLKKAKPVVPDPETRPDLSRPKLPEA
jgi:tricorn protease